MSWTVSDLARGDYLRRRSAALRLELVDVQAEIVAEAIRLAGWGMPFVEIAELFGVSPATARRWVRGY